jgi:hypothetical protein
MGSTSENFYHFSMTSNYKSINGLIHSWSQSPYDPITSLNTICTWDQVFNTLTFLWNTSYPNHNSPKECLLSQCFILSKFIVEILTPKVMILRDGNDFRSWGCFGRLLGHEDGALKIELVPMWKRKGNCTIPPGEVRVKRQLPVKKSTKDIGLWLDFPVSRTTKENKLLLLVSLSV